MKLHPRTLNSKYKNFLFFADWYLGTSLEVHILVENAFMEE